MERALKMHLLKHQSSFNGWISPSKVGTFSVRSIGGKRRWALFTNEDKPLMAAVEFRKSGSLKCPRKEPMWLSLFPILALPILLLGILGLPTVPQMLRQSHLRYLQSQHMRIECHWSDRRLK